MQNTSKKFRRAEFTGFVHTKLILRLAVDYLGYGVVYALSDIHVIAVKLYSALMYRSPKRYMASRRNSISGLCTWKDCTDLTLLIIIRDGFRWQMTPRGIV